MPNLTVSIAEITDLVRTLGVQGDGRAAPDSSFGIYPGATNLVPNGGAETNTTGWATSGPGTLSRITTDHKFGSACLSWVATATGSAVITSDMTVTAGNVYTVSPWLNRAGTANSFGLVFMRSDFGAQIVGPTIPTVLGWQRVIWTITIPTGWTAGHITLVNNAASAWEAIKIDGAQFETGSIATPYIETNGATATRGAARVQASAGVFNPTTFAFFARIRAGFASTDPTIRRIAYWSQDGSNFITLLWNGGGSWLLERQGAGIDAQVSLADSFAVGDILTIGGYGNATTIGISRKGSAYTTTPHSSPPATMPATFDIGSNGGTAEFAACDFLWVATFTGTPPDPTQAFLNSNTDPTLGQFSAANDARMVWPANTAAYDAASNEIQFGTLTFTPELTGAVAVG